MLFRFRNKMTQAGFTIAGAAHPICPVMLGDARLASLMADDMLKLGETAVKNPDPDIKQSRRPQKMFRALLTRLFPPQECTWSDSPSRSCQRAKPESAFRSQPPTQRKTSTTASTLSSRPAESTESSPELDKGAGVGKIQRPVQCELLNNVNVEPLALTDHAACYWRPMRAVDGNISYICRSTEVNVIFVSALLNKALLLTCVGVCILRRAIKWLWGYS